jgi:6-methylsalicylate decarboxylase
VERRTFVAGFATAGAAALLDGERVRAQGPPPRRRIDVHHHFLPPRFVAEARDQKAGGTWIPAILQWTPERSLEQMDRNGIAAAVMSLGLPGVAFGGVEAGRRRAREVNEFAAQMQRDHPGRFGVFATLPMPDVEGSLAEISYALDVLKFDGVGFLTSYGNRWPGDASFVPIFDELQRRKAVAFFHPTAPQCCSDLIPEMPAAAIEYLFDSTRAAGSLLYSGTITRCPDVRYIFNHAGGAIPMLARRITRLADESPVLGPRFPHGAMAALQQLYFDTATSTSPPTLAALRAFAPVGKILLGTDYPYLPMSETLPGLEAAQLDPVTMTAIASGNALALFPRLRLPAA